MQLISRERNSTVVCLARSRRDSEYQYCLVSFQEDKNQDLQIQYLNLLETTDLVDNSLKAPSLALSNGGPIAFIAFSDRLVLTSIDEAIQFEEVVPFKTKDLIGIGAENSMLLSSEWQPSCTARLYCSSVGVLQVEVTMGSLQSSAKKPTNESSVVTENTTNSRLEQIVFFNQSENPIKLELGLIESDLNAPSLELSESILSSSNLHLPNILDETEYFCQCVGFSHDIIQSINNNQMRDKLTESTRFQLMFNTEKLIVMKDLWEHQNYLYL